MRTAMLSLVIVAVLGLAASTASAAGPHNAQVSATLVCAPRLGAVCTTAITVRSWSARRSSSARRSIGPR